ncbi:MAG: hypothetical protein U5K37_08985 [Natrialbaceae archaeon]|nr:hypothetical protein [Natrialbaceae archaeon]
MATNHGFVSGLPTPVLSDLDPARIVLLEASAETISERRSDVEHRVYREQGRRAIDLHQDLNRAAAMQYAIATDAAVRLVENEGSVEAAADDLAQIIAESDPAR